LATVTVAKLEEGRTPDPKASTLAKLAAGLDCKVGDLVEADRNRFLPHVREVR